MIWLAVASAMTLEEARSGATERALAVQLAAADEERARGSSTVALSDALPSLGAFASINTGSGLTAFGFDRPVPVQAGVGVNGTWSLVAPSAWAATSAARHSRRGRQAVLDWARATARRDATIAYANALAAQSVLEARRAAEADATRALAAAKSVVAAELRPPSDAAQAEALRASLEAARVASEGDVVQTCAVLQALVQPEVDGSCALVPAPEDALSPGTATSEHPALRAASAAADAAKAARKAVLLGRVPVLSADGTVAQYAVTGRPPGPGWNAGLRVDLPLGGGGEGVGRLKEATADREAAAVALDQQTRELKVARLGAEARHDAAAAAVLAFEAALEAADTALRLVDQRYQQGLEDLENHVAARRARDDARVALAQARAAHLIAVAELEAARGVW